MNIEYAVFITLEWLFFSIRAFVAHSILAYTFYIMEDSRNQGVVLFTMPEYVYPNTLKYWQQCNTRTVIPKWSDQPKRTPRGTPTK